MKFLTVKEELVLSFFFSFTRDRGGQQVAEQVDCMRHFTGRVCQLFENVSIHDTPRILSFAMTGTFEEKFEMSP